MFSKIREKTLHLKYGREVVSSLATRAISDCDFAKILDLGAANGDDLINIRNAYRGECELFGVEFLPESIEICRQRGITAHPVDLECQRLPCDDETFDLVISNQTYEHIKNIFWCTSEVCRVLKPRGHFLVGVPNLASPHCSIPLLFGKQPRQIKVHGPHVRGYTVDGLKDLFLTDGYFELVTFSGSGFYPFPLNVAKLLSKVLPAYSTSVFCLLRRTDKSGSFIEGFKERYFYETSYFVG